MTKTTAPTSTWTQHDQSRINQWAQQFGNRNDGLLEALHAIQDHYRYLPEKALQEFAKQSQWSYSHILSVATFYEQFRLTPAGRHTIAVCTGTTCHVKGAGAVYDAFARHLKIPNGSDTDTDALFTLRKVACLGCCTLAPAVQIDQLTFGHVSPDKVATVLDNFLKVQNESTSETSSAQTNNPSDQIEIRIGLDSCCCARGCDKVYTACEQAIAQHGLNVKLKPIGCVGLCAQTPMVEIAQKDQPSIYYFNVAPDDIPALLHRHIPGFSWQQRLKHQLRHHLDNLLIGTTPAIEPINSQNQTEDDPAQSPLACFEKSQVRIATEHFACDDPDDLSAYRQQGGFTAWQQIKNHQDPANVIATITQAQLRGRGGAGFLTGQKWQTTAQQQDTQRYVVCNADEGDPGAFMDRMLLESFPFRIIEGMLIAAYAVQAQHAYFYIRHEYPLAYQRICQALEQCRQVGLISDPAKQYANTEINHNRSDSTEQNKDDKHNSGTQQNDFSLTIEVVQGAGAFVCGEETALIASIESQRPFPRPRPPYPSQKGLWHHPTLINNVETLAMVPWIMRHGAQQFLALGSEGAHGTKVFSLVGKINRPSLIEVPLGMTIRQVVEDIGQGIPNGKAFKAVQIGGPSGACIPAHLADMPIDYQSLKQIDAIMGSGGIVVLDEDDCMVEIARYFLAFTMEQSCGKCSFCRIGTYQMHAILERICQGKGHHDDLEKLETLAHQVHQGSLCGLGKTAANPVLSTLTYFRDEYLAHLQGTCTAKKCPTLIHYHITDDCIGCTRCTQHCPVDAIPFTPYQQHEIDDTLCVRCGSCQAICPVQAIEVNS